MGDCRGDGNELERFEMRGGAVSGAFGGVGDGVGVGGGEGEEVVGCVVDEGSAVLTEGADERGDLERGISD
jgi:hypothetical protein